MKRGVAESGTRGRAADCDSGLVVGFGWQFTEESFLRFTIHAQIIAISVERQIACARRVRGGPAAYSFKRGIQQGSSVAGMRGTEGRDRPGDRRDGAPAGRIAAAAPGRLGTGK